MDQAQGSADGIRMGRSHEAEGRGGWDTAKDSVRNAHMSKSGMIA